MIDIPFSIIHFQFSILNSQFLKWNEYVSLNGSR